MKNHIVLLLFCIVLLKSNSWGDENKNTYKQIEFQRITLQRSWNYASLLLKEGSIEVRKEHARTMVTMAFHYWIMRRHNLIVKMAIYESQIKKSFKNGDLDFELLKDPLGRFTSHVPTYTLSGFNFTDDEYKIMLPKFKAFILDD